ncbi:MAG: FeoA family protein [Candidatus Heimdallarchaeaceae archaeon]|jgi:ferrous iron transport protein A
MTELPSLLEIGENEIVEVRFILAGEKAHRFLADLGIHETENLRIVKNDIGPIIVEVKSTRVALGRGIASKIKVQVI